MANLTGHVTGESILAPLRVGFHRRLKLQFHGTKLSSDGGLLLFRELDEAQGLSFRVRVEQFLRRSFTKIVTLSCRGLQEN